MIFSQGGGNIGIGFAIPINMAKKLIPELEDHGHVTRGWLGVSIQKLTPELGESLGVTDGHGALVAQVTEAARPRRRHRARRRHHDVRRQDREGLGRAADARRGHRDRP
jgi:hypothetical protein